MTGDSLSKILTMSVILSGLRLYLIHHVIANVPLVRLWYDIKIIHFKMDMEAP
jgi:hypothetical protein